MPLALEQNCRCPAARAQQRSPPAVLCLPRTLCCVQVKGMLEEYRIGRLKGGQAAGAGADPYANEPQRLPALIVRTQKPMNSGG